MVDKKGGEMKYTIEERFTDSLGFTYEKADGKEDGRAKGVLYIMRHSENVFEFLDSERYEIARRQYREELKAQKGA